MWEKHQLPKLFLLCPDCQILPLFSTNGISLAIQIEVFFFHMTIVIPGGNEMGGFLKLLYVCRVTKAPGAPHSPTHICNIHFPARKSSSKCKAPFEDRKGGRKKKGGKTFWVLHFLVSPFPSFHFWDITPYNVQILSIV